MTAWVSIIPKAQWSVSYQEWRDEAPCRELPTHWFELDDEFDPSSSDELSLTAQHRVIAKGLKVCADCPVRQSCLSDSNVEDRYWSTRGGQPPEGLFPDGDMPKVKHVPIKGFTIKRSAQLTCKRGHDDWMTDGRGKRRCRTCRKAENQTGWKKRKAKAA